MCLLCFRGVIVAIAIALAGCDGGMPPPTDPTGLGYPALYRGLELPELPGGEVIDTGRQTTSLRDGLSIQVMTAMTLDEAREFYVSAIEAAGWELQPSRSLPGMPVARIEASRGGIRFTATFTEWPDGGTRVDLSVVEN